MKIKRIRKSKRGRIEVIPMIDVMFFLLATFMLASLSMQRFEGLAVNLVKGKADKTQIEKQITFTITHDNSIFLNKEQITLEIVTKKLAELLNKASNKTIIIASDQDAKQGVVMRVMLNAKKAGANNFSMITRR